MLAALRHTVLLRLLWHQEKLSLFWEKVSQCPTARNFPETTLLFSFSKWSPWCTWQRAETLTLHIWLLHIAFENEGEKSTPADNFLYMICRNLQSLCKWHLKPELAALGHLLPLPLLNMLLLQTFPYQPKTEC